MDIVKRQMSHNYSVRNDTIQYIVIHDTGNEGVGANAAAHFNYFNGADRDSSADIFVDDCSAWYINDYKKFYSWHCGDGNGQYGITNQNSVGVEICVNADGDYSSAFANTVDVVRGLMAELNIPAERVVRHYDASRKACPNSMMVNDWEKWKEFKQRIESEELTLSQYEELNARLDRLENPVIYNYIDGNMPAWARPTIQKLVNKGVLKGDENGLNLTEDLMRILVVNDRAGLYE